MKANKSKENVIKFSQNGYAIKFLNLFNIL
jgi:hypothetical protein